MLITVGHDEGMYLGEGTETLKKVRGRVEVSAFSFWGT
jgi:hypothetical protein